MFGSINVQMRNLENESHTNILDELGINIISAEKQHEDCV